MRETTVWVVSDGVAGNMRQAEALAQAMGTRPRVFHAPLAWPWRWWAPRGLARNTRALPANVRLALEQERPDLVIGCGRAAAMLTRWLRRHHGAFAVQILDPRADPRHWDTLIAPVHDRLRGENVVSMIGSVHDITPQRLAEAARQFPELGDLPAPRTALLVGGTTRCQRLDADYWDSLLVHLDDWHSAEGGSILVTASRRTDVPSMIRLQAHFAGRPLRLWRNAADGPNPYLGFLAHAQRIVVTPDSVNMLSEACATGKPVYTHAPQPLRGKLAAFHRSLRDAGRLHLLGEAEAAWCDEPLLETPAVAEEVWRRYHLRRLASVTP